MANKEMFVLAVALLTWAGVFVYLLRVDGLARRLERELREREQEAVPVERLDSPVRQTVERAD